MLRIIVVSICSLLFASAYAGPHKTENYYKCFNRQGGVWKMGQAGNICDLHPFMPVNISKQYYSPLIFNVNNGRVLEQTRYSNEAYAFLKDLAPWYLLKRKPTASQEEIDGWTTAVYAMAMQESYWSHYRIQGNHDVQLMRGDVGHGHGMFQVDDRWHFDAVERGVAANLVQNVVYGLDIYYDGWRRAASSKCLKDPTDYYNRARAAYSAFNGGSGSICRWTNPNHKWAQNDVNFKKKLDGQVWWEYITNKNLKNQIDIPCIAAGGKNCDNFGFDVPAPQIVEFKGVYDIGSFITLKKNINFRSTPGGSLIGTFKANSSFQVLGVEKDENGTSDRYYHLSDGTRFGYIFAGNNSSFANWAIAGNGEHAKKFIFVAGDVVEVNGFVYTVKRFEITKNNTLFYYAVDEKGVEKRIAGGYVGLEVRLEESVKAYVAPVYPTAHLKNNVYYARVKKSPKFFSSSVVVLKGPKLNRNANLEVLGMSEKWALVKVNGVTGYIKLSNIEIER